MTLEPLDADRPAERSTIEPLKMIADWSKWIITLETAILAGVGSKVLDGSTQPLGIWVIALGAIAGVAFFFSIAAAALLLLSLPQITQNWRPGDDWWAHEDPYLSGYFRFAHRHLRTPRVRLTIERLAVLEGAAFIFGLFFLLCGLLVLTIRKG